MSLHARIERFVHSIRSASSRRAFTSLHGSLHCTRYTGTEVWLDPVSCMNFAHGDAVVCLGAALKRYSTPCSAVCNGRRDIHSCRILLHVDVGDHGKEVAVAEIAYGRSSTASIALGQATCSSRSAHAWAVVAMVSVGGHGRGGRLQRKRGSTSPHFAAESTAKRPGSGVALARLAWARLCINLPRRPYINACACTRERLSNSRRARRRNFQLWT